MRAGKLRNMIRVQRATMGVNDFGTPSPVWTDHLKLRAEVVERSASEFLTGEGAVDEARIVFRTRFVEDVTRADRVAFDGVNWNIRETAEVGRREGLELRCVADREDGA